MTIDETANVDDLDNFTDQEILRATKYRCAKDRSNPGCFIYKIKIGKMIFTIKISPDDLHFQPNDSTKQKLAEGSINFLLARLRQKTGLYPNKFPN